MKKERYYHQKGSTVVTQDRQEYIETGLEHLSGRDTYNELEEDQTKQQILRIRHYVT